MICTYAFSRIFDLVALPLPLYGTSALISAAFFALPATEAIASLLASASIPTDSFCSLSGGSGGGTASSGVTSPSGGGSSSGEIASGAANAPGALSGPPAPFFCTSINSSGIISCASSMISRNSDPAITMFVMIALPRRLRSTNRARSFTIKLVNEPPTSMALINAFFLSSSSAVEMMSISIENLLGSGFSPLYARWICASLVTAAMIARCSFFTVRAYRISIRNREDCPKPPRPPSSENPRN